MNIILKNIIRFIVLILLQVTVFNNIQLSGFINPYLYILFILLLPFETPPWLLLVLAFFTGLSIDIFSNTIGIHASACVFMAFLRPFVLNIVSVRDNYDCNIEQGLSVYGFSWFFKYALILTLAHHSFLFIVEVFSFNNFGDTLIRIILSTIFTLVLVITSQFIISKK
ncbi:rod shape-determining protein MreD [Ancylomarina sp. 16SWW S1-10-2]|uniref:rod shape-determining protein MreD n=1 Tax=Ancylomarina sp. 16SWW S1-10-2 TaxID=2499681 RepID=UPI0012AE25A7|nr:rod shape-determining protein MreD [Ancylomarina sp. 16SWW S1-10-2]MRT91682.1 rod shape-determining protein MreD [Ancylomarina sp. 16SWW S1-10-2]